VERPPTLPEQACLVQVYGPDLGKRSSIGREAFNIGRSPRSDLCIDQASISRHHARITWDGERHHVADLGSTNGTHINDVPVSVAPLADGDFLRVGRAIMKYMSGDDIEASFHEAIYRMMTVDALTDTYNRRYFDDALEREIVRAGRYERPVSLVLLDVDYFKVINDTYGHVAGDQVLRQLAAAVRGKLRQLDIFARVGGEEFGLILPESDLETAKVVAERLRHLIGTALFRAADKEIACTVSLGAAEWHAEMKTPVTLYEAADKKLYAAKEGGRNRTES
jgi:diguanylate cyclase (GGDEF)-like protein